MKTNQGAPFRIALSYTDDSHYNELILLDHIPHNDPGQQNDIYAVDVTIPNINWCDNYWFESNF